MDKLLAVRSDESMDVLWVDVMVDGRDLKKAVVTVG